MKSLLEELKIYNSNVRLAKTTITNYNYSLKKFFTYLSVEMNTDPKDIHLKKVFLLKDSLGKPIKYMPIEVLNFLTMKFLNT